MSNAYLTKEDVLFTAKIIKNKTLRDIISQQDLDDIEKKLQEYGTNRKGYLGDLIEKYVFGLENNSRSEADFLVAGVELKVTPIKSHASKDYVSKERLVFSMIDYDRIVFEKWETSSFLEKNKLLLILFYLFELQKSVLDLEFKFIYLLNLLEDISAQDVEQIKKDWEFIVAKIKKGEAHLLSEGDTYYLGACTKARDSSVLRDQPKSRIPAKPRAFSLKQTYLNYIIQRNILGKKSVAVSIYEGENIVKSIEEIVSERFEKYIDKTDRQILKSLNLTLGRESKQYKRLLANSIFRVGSDKIEELEKANVTMKVITLEASGKLKESLSFSSFEYKNLILQSWYDEQSEEMSDFHAQLEKKKFLFIVFQKIKGSDDIILKKTLFWNFPMKDIEKAKDVWEETVRLIESGKIIKEIVVQKDGKEKRLTYFPGITFNGVAHVRPHGKDSEDVSSLPVADELTGERAYTKHCFWLNANYIQQSIELAPDKI